MKTKMLPLLLASVLCITGCRAKLPAPTEATLPPATEPVTLPVTEPTTIPTEPETQPLPATVSASAAVPDTPVILARLHRGDKLEVVGKYDNSYMVVLWDGHYALAERDLLRLSSDPAFTTWTGYGSWSGNLYPDYALTGTPIMQLHQKRVEVLEEIGNALMVSLDGQIGFVEKNAISKWAPSGYNGYGGGGYSGGGGGYSSGNDGGDISLQAYRSAPEGGTVTGTATAKVDNTDVICGFFDLNDSIDVITENGYAPRMDGFRPVLLARDNWGYVRSDLLTMAGDPPYAQWTGYAKYGTIMYSSYRMTGEAVHKPYSDAQVTVLREFDNCYYISCSGKTGYAAKSMISRNRTTQYYDYGGGYSGGGGGGGGEWTPPAL